MRMNGKNRVGKPQRWNDKFIRSQIQKYQTQMLHSRFHWRAIRSKILMFYRLGMLESLMLKDDKQIDSDGDEI